MVISDDNEDDDGDVNGINEVTPTTSLKSYHDVLSSVRDIEIFLAQRGIFTIASEFCKFK